MVSKLPRAAGTGVVAKRVEADGIVEKWEKSKWAQKLAFTEKRRSLNDFARFNVMLEKKQRRNAAQS